VDVNNNRVLDVDQVIEPIAELDALVGFRGGRFFTSLKSPSPLPVGCRARSVPHAPRIGAWACARAPASQTIQRNRLATAWASSRSNPSRCATWCVRRAISWKTQASTSNVAHGQGAAGVCVSD